MFPLICVWITGWVNNREAGDLRRYRGHYDVIVMCPSTPAETNGWISIVKLEIRTRALQWYATGLTCAQTFCKIRLTAHNYTSIMPCGLFCKGFGGSPLRNGSLGVHWYYICMGKSSHSWKMPSCDWNLHPHAQETLSSLSRLLLLGISCVRLLYKKGTLKCHSLNLNCSCHVID